MNTRNTLACPYCGADAVENNDNLKGTEKAQRLLEDMRQMHEEIAEEDGQNVSYCTSMDFSLFPSVILLILSREDEVDDILTDLHFLAENGNKFPESLQNAELEDFRKYALANMDSILDEIREDCEYDYQDSIGFPFRRRTFHCPECDRLFDEEDIEFEDFRHKISASCSKTRADEKSPRPFTATPVIGNADGSFDPKENPQAIGAFHDPEGKVWFLLADSNKQVIINIDNLNLTDLRKIWDSIIGVLLGE